MLRSPVGARLASAAAASFLIVGMFAIFYFLIIRPQKRKEKEQKERLNKLQKGDEVITHSGLYGRIAGITDDIVTLEVASQIKIRVTKSSVAGLAAQPMSMEKHS